MAVCDYWFFHSEYRKLDFLQVNFFPINRTRVVQGACAGINFAETSKYLKGITSISLLAVAANIGAAGMLFGGVLDTAIFLPYAWNWLEQGSKFWYFTLFLGAIFPVFRLILSLTFIINPPLHYLKTGDEETARALFEKLYPYNDKEESINEEKWTQVINSLIIEEKIVNSVKLIASPNTTLLRNNEPSPRNAPQKRSIKKSKMSSKNKAAMVGIFVWFFNQLTGVQGVNSYSHDTFLLVTSEKIATYITIALSVISFLTCIASTLYIKKAQRTILLISGGMLCAICLWLMAYFTYTNNVTWNITFQCTYRFIYGTTVSAATWPYITEICMPDKVYIPFLSHWGIIGLIVLAFPIVTQNFGTDAVFAALGLITMINTLIAYFLLRETQGLDKESIKLLYKGKKEVELQGKRTAWPGWNGDGVKIQAEGGEQEKFRKGSNESPLLKDGGR